MQLWMGSVDTSICSFKKIALFQRLGPRWLVTSQHLSPLFHEISSSRQHRKSLAWHGKLDAGEIWLLFLAFLWIAASDLYERDECVQIKTPTPTCLFTPDSRNVYWTSERQVDYNYSCVARQPCTHLPKTWIGGFFHSNCSSIMV